MRATYTAREVAALIGCGKHELNKMVERGELPPPVIGYKAGARHKRFWRRDQVHNKIGAPILSLLDGDGEA